MTRLILLILVVLIALFMIARCDMNQAIDRHQAKASQIAPRKWETERYARWHSRHFSSWPQCWRIDGSTQAPIPPCPM